jgi:hypothetical protein
MLSAEFSLFGIEISLACLSLHAFLQRCNTAIARLLDKEALPVIADSTFVLDLLLA